MSGISPLLILCSTARLARSLRLADERRQQAQGRAQWPPLPAQTLMQWLGETVTQAMLAGEIPLNTLPVRALDDMAERLLWETVISQSLADNPAQALFDMAGMARCAAEANALMVEWDIPAPSGQSTQEARQFLNWRSRFQSLCQRHQALEAARLFDLYAVCLERGAAHLPQYIQLAGFDRISPQQQRLFDVLARRGVAITHYAAGLPQAAVAVRLQCDDAEAECRAAVAWAAQKLASGQRLRLAILAPELGALRARLAALLDDTLQPQALHPAHAEMPRRHDFSLGEPLSTQPLVASALVLLELALRRHKWPQAEFSRLLRNVYWSAGISEADARAQLEARMRRKLPASISLQQCLRFLRQPQQQGLPLSRLQQHLQALRDEAASWPRRQRLADWAGAFARLLHAAGWPGERGLSSHEFQTRRAWAEVLAELAALDSLLGILSPQQALARLANLCGERIFQPETEGQPPLLVMGMLEAAAEPLDALWVMGMNDHLWPPPARPNALLPAQSQRHAGAPNACGRVQAEFAGIVQRRLLHSAAEVVFSWARREGERELRMSPLLQDYPDIAAAAGASTLAEQLAQAAAMQWLEDQQAPALSVGEKTGGGASLFRAQAICPAWAYYRYRLGARALQQAAEGLDAMQRGSLLHAVMQAFWQGRDSAWLHGMDHDTLQGAILQAIEEGICRFAATQDEAPPPKFMALERGRLQRLLHAWLKLEKARPPFAVSACEQRLQQEIGGFRVDLALDRVDRLPQGGLLVLDYKTGAVVSHKSWADERISEPQLPLYASLALAGEEVVAVCFAKLHADEQKFIGISAASGLLPGVKTLDESRTQFPASVFPDWSTLMAHWRAGLLAIAAEIRAGEAAVRFSDENELRDCDVKPLLRLPERKLQLERGGQGGAALLSNQFHQASVGDEEHGQADGAPFVLK